MSKERKEGRKEERKKGRKEERERKERKKPINQSNFIKLPIRISSTPSLCSQSVVYRSPFTLHCSPFT
jgi:hypothetical protein